MGLMKLTDVDEVSSVLESAKAIVIQDSAVKAAGMSALIQACIGGISYDELTGTVYIYDADGEQIGNECEINSELTQLNVTVETSEDDSGTTEYYMVFLNGDGEEITRCQLPT